MDNKPREPAAPARPPRPGTVAGARWLLWSTVAAGGCVIVGSLVNLRHGVDSPWVWTFLPLAIAAEMLTVRVSESQKQRISISFTIAVTMAAVVMAPSLAPLVSLSAAALHVVMQRQRQWDKVCFNLANPTVAAAVACGVWGAYVRLPVVGHPLVAALMAALSFYLANSSNITFIVSLNSGRRFWDLFRESAWYGPTTVMLGLTGAYLGQSYGQLGPAGLAIFAAPLLILRYTLVLYAERSQETIAALQTAMAETERAQAEREETLQSLILTVSSIIDARDHAVSGHSRRVAHYAVALGRQLGLAEAELVEIHTAGLLHDVGKIAIPELILNKPARLTDEEYRVMQTHAAIGQQVLSEVKPLQRVARMVGEHHERYDGQGYPGRKAADEITLGGRLLAVADALDSILANRPYSKGKGLDWALQEINRCSGSHFDPAVVGALNRVLETEGPGFFAGSHSETASAQAAAARENE